MTKTHAAHLASLAVAVACGQAHALGFGHVDSDVPLGQPLAFVVPVRVEAAEHFSADCVKAQVVVGDAPVPANQVRTTVLPGKSEGEWLVRVGTTFAVEEPVVEVTLDAGCGRQFSRKFTAFANPVNPVVMATAATPAGKAAPAAPDRPRSTGSTGSTSGATRSRAPDKAAVVAARNEAGAPVRAGAVAAAVPGAAPAAGDGARLVLDAGFGGPRLKMDLNDPVIPPEGAGAPPAAAALGAEVGANVQTLRGLQANIDQMRRESRADRERTAALEAQLASARAQDDWMPWLLGLLGLSVVAAILLAWRLHRISQAHAHSRWFTDSQLAPGSAGVPTPTLADALPEAREPERPLPTIDVAAVPDVETAKVTAPAATTRTEPLAPEPPPARAPAADAATPPPAGAVITEVAVEELLDLEQQADFFIALGQEDAAIDLLMQHLRSAGGQSPLPYTKLLEIFRRQGDRAAYERTRARFNRRFNAYAPDWDTGPGSGRVLEDYPATVEQIQGAWIAPIDAMAILEALLFRRDETSELFDLPAYRDVLLLYAIARDLWQHGAGAGGSPIDVLLPMDPSGVPPAFEPTLRAGLESLESVPSFAPPFEEAAVTSFSLPVLDDVGAAAAASAFGELHASLHLEPHFLEPSPQDLPELEEGTADEPGASDDRRHR